MMKSDVLRELSRLHPTARLIGPGDDNYGRDRYKIHFDRIEPRLADYNPIYEPCTE